jgi:hypothetical protein
MMLPRIRNHGHGRIPDSEGITPDHSTFKRWLNTPSPAPTTDTHMNLLEKRTQFETTKRIHSSAKVTFNGVDGFDVYNASIPFTWQGDTYIFGRVERRSEWARSWVRLFRNSGVDSWTVVSDSMIYQLEDPYICWIKGELILGGTHVRMKGGKVDTYYGYFYRGRNLHDLVYFTTGPDYMKDIRLVELADGRIGAFSRPRNEEIRRRFGSESQIGFTIIDDLNGLTGDVIENAPYIPDLFAKDEWGGCNQAYLLDSGLIGVIGHQCANRIENGVTIQVYLNVAFVFDPAQHRVIDFRIIGSRPCYPDGPAKKPGLIDCAFTSGIVPRSDGHVDLYSGISDTEVGRLVIDNPFSDFGQIVERGA